MADWLKKLFPRRKKQTAENAAPTSKIHARPLPFWKRKKFAANPEAFGAPGSGSSALPNTEDVTTHREEASAHRGQTEDHLTKQTKTVGRGPHCDIVLTHPTVSGTHCEIQQMGAGAYSIRDLGSTNGTYINGQRVYMQWTMIQYGDILKLGAYECAFEQQHNRLPTLFFK